MHEELKVAKTALSIPRVHFQHFEKFSFQKLLEHKDKLIAKLNEGE